MRCWISLSRPRTRVWVLMSRALVGSSQMMRRGLSARARAIAMRWRCPPENSRARRRPASVGRPTASRSSRTRSRREAGVPSRIGSARMSAIDIDGFSDEYGSWKIACTSRARSRRSRRRRPPMSVPSSRMRPDVTGASPRTARPIVVLPEPDSPTRPSVSPGAMSRLTSSMIRFVERRRPDRYSTTRFSTRSSGVASVITPPRGRARMTTARACKGVRGRRTTT